MKMWGNVEFEMWNGLPAINQRCPSGPDIRV